VGVSSIAAGAAGSSASAGGVVVASSSGLISSAVMRWTSVDPEIANWLRITEYYR
jgi:hypothetical protein